MYKKNGGQIVDDTDLLTIQNNKKTYIKPSILYYYKKNTCIFIDKLEHIAWHG